MEKGDNYDKEGRQTGRATSNGSFASRSKSRYGFSQTYGLYITSWFGIEEVCTKIFEL